MKMLASLTLLLLSAPAIGEPAPQPVQRRGDQLDAFEARRKGHLMPYEEIERRILPRMGGYQYLGVELDGSIYTFKFLRDGNVVWIYVDGQSGRVISRRGG